MEQSIDKRPLFGYFIGYSNDSVVRYKGSSGGIGSSLMKYLLTTETYDSVVSFRFNEKKCLYEPILVHDPNYIQIVGSIYQDIDVLSFLRNNIDEIVKGVVVSCPPCQVYGVKKIMDKAHKKCFIISFNCSGQTIVEGTWKYYDYLGLNKSDVISLQYRGNGWPSGIQIVLNNGKKIFHKNWTEPWVTIHNSYLFRPDRCLFCKFDTSYDSDISLADPWLDRYLKRDDVGCTFFLVNTDLGKKIIDDMLKNGLLTIVEQSNYEDYFKAQKPNVLKEVNLKNLLSFYRFVLKLKHSTIYFKIVTNNYKVLRLHNKFLIVLRKLLTIQN